MARPQTTDPRASGAAMRPSSLSASEVNTTDWPAQAADTIERVVQSVRDKTTGPAISAVRWVVAGLFLVLVGVMVAVLLVVALVRVIDVYLPSSLFGDHHVWAAHTVVGLPLFLAGLVLLAKRHPVPDR
ncbi:MAG: hypothetical protein ABIP36_03035 [Acidimicrobiales bacterium]